MLGSSIERTLNVNNDALHTDIAYRFKQQPYFHFSTAGERLFGFDVDSSFREVSGVKFMKFTIID